MGRSSHKNSGNWKQKLLHIAVVCSLIVVLFFQIITLVAIHPQSIVNAPQAILDATWLFPTLLATVILVYVAVVLYKVWKTAEKRLLIPAALGAIGTVLSLVIALTIRAAYDNVVGLDGMVALTDWEWFWQQGSLVVVALITCVASLVRFKQAREERLSREESAYEDQFAGEESTLFGGDTPTVGAPKKNGKKLSKKTAQDAERKAKRR